MRLGDESRMKVLVIGEGILSVNSWRLEIMLSGT